MVIAVDLRALMSGNVSGVETYITQLLKNLLKLEHKNTYVLYTSGAKLQPHIAEMFHGTNVRFVHTKISNRILNALLVFIRRPRLDRLIEKKLGLKSDVFFIPDLRPAPLSKNVKKITVVHDLAYYHFPQFFSFKTKLWYAVTRPQKELKESHHIITVSEATKKDLISTYHISSEIITVIHEGIAEEFCKNEPEKKEGLQKKYHLPTDYFLFLSTLEPRKNVSRVIEAYKLFRKKNPQSKTKLVLAGKQDRKIFSDVELKHHPDIFFPGFIKEEDKGALYRHAQAFLYPSLFEGFGLPLLEAMKCGTPLITSDRSSMPEVVSDAAILVNPEKAESIADAMEEVLKPDIKKNLKEKMANRIKHFSWEKCAKETLQILES